MRSWIVLCGFCAAAVSACSTLPAVTRESMTMTKAEIAAEGLVCRKDQPANTIIPRTVCASETAWAAFDERRKSETDKMIEEGRQNSTFSRFSVNNPGPPR